MTNGAEAVIIENSVPERADFKAYLEKSLRDPFTLDLRDCTLIEIIRVCIRSKSRLHPEYYKQMRALIYNLKILEEKYRMTLIPSQVTDIFWGHFIRFCQDRGLRNSSISVMCSQLKSILNWAVKHGAIVSPTYGDFRVPYIRNNEIALTADEVSRIAYFDVDRFYANKRKDFRKTMERVRDMFILSCNLGQRHGDMLRIGPSCFERNIFKITQQKTGNIAVVNIDKYAIDAKTTYRILEKYNYKAPYTASIGNYNFKLHQLMKDIGFTEIIRTEEKIADIMVVRETPKYELIASHTARRTFITINIVRGANIHSVKRCSGHSDIRCFEKYVRDE